MVNQRQLVIDRKIKGNRWTKSLRKLALRHPQSNQSSRRSSDFIQPMICPVSIESGRRVQESTTRSFDWWKPIGVYRLYSWPRISRRRTSPSPQKLFVHICTRPNFEAASLGRNRFSREKTRSTTPVRPGAQEQSMESWRKFQWSEESNFNLISLDRPTKVWR